MATKTHKLSGEKRSIVGKKVKQLRANDVLPGNVYGKNIKSLAVQVGLKDFQTLYNEVGETGLVELTVAGEKKPHPVLIQNPQLHPVSGAYLHVDFHEVELTEKMRVQVPIELIGESPAAEKALGVLIQNINELEVEALPTELPESIDVDITNLKEVGDEIKVSDIKAKAGYTITEEPETTIVRINPLEKEEEAAPAPADEGEEAPTEGEEKPAEDTEKSAEKADEAPKKE